MPIKAKVLSFSLTEGTIDVLRAISEADERTMSAEVRHLIRSRAHALLNAPHVDEKHKEKIRSLMHGDEFVVFA